MPTTYNKPPVGSAWAESAANPADIITMSDADIKVGWPLTGTPPPRQRMNFVLNWCANAIRYFMQRGLVDYDAAENYAIGARVIGDDGLTYVSLINANIGNTPSTSPTDWALWALSLAQINASLLTQANVTTGDTSLKVANTNFVAAAITQFATTVAALIAGTNLIAQNGYHINTSNGLIEQWGLVAMPTGGSHVDGSVIFPIPFPNNVFNIQLTPASKQPNFGSWSAITAMALSANLNGFTPALDSSNTGQSFNQVTYAYWRAIGN